MKITLTFICTIFFLQIASAQLTAATDQKSQPLWEKYVAKYYRPIFVLDSKQLSDASARSVLDAIDPHAVAKVLITHGTSATGGRDVIYIMIDSRIAAYQRKLSTFSPAYAKYLQKHKNRDDSVAYRVNGQPLTGLRAEAIARLDALQPDKITTVSVSHLDVVGGGDGTVTVSIKTR